MKKISRSHAVSGVTVRASIPVIRCCINYYRSDSNCDVETSMHTCTERDAMY